MNKCARFISHVGQGQTLEWDVVRFLVPAVKIDSRKEHLKKFGPQTKKSKNRKKTRKRRKKTAPVTSSVCNRNCATALEIPDWLRLDGDHRKKSARPEMGKGRDRDESCVAPSRGRGFVGEGPSGCDPSPQNSLFLGLKAWAPPKRGGDKWRPTRSLQEKNKRRCGYAWLSSSGTELTNTVINYSAVLKNTARFIIIIQKGIKHR